MKVVNREKLLQVITARRKGNHTEFEIGVGYETDDSGVATGRIRMRTEQLDSGNSPVVASVSAEEALRLLTGLAAALEAIGK